MYVSFDCVVLSVFVLNLFLVGGCFVLIIVSFWDEVCMFVKNFEFLSKKLFG